MQDVMKVRRLGDILGELGEIHIPLLEQRRHDIALDTLIIIQGIDAGHELYLHFFEMLHAFVVFYYHIHRALLAFHHQRLVAIERQGPAHQCPLAHAFCHISHIDRRQHLQFLQVEDVDAGQHDGPHYPLGIHRIDGGRGEQHPVERRVGIIPLVGQQDMVKQAPHIRIVRLQQLPPMFFPTLGRLEREHGHIGHMVFQPLPDSVRVEINATGRQPIGGVMIGRIVFFLEFYLYVLD